MKKVKYLVLLTIGFSLFVCIAYAANPSNNDKTEIKKFIIHKTKNEKIIKHDDKEIKELEEKYSQIIKEWKKTPTIKSKTVAESVYLSGDENNLDLIFEEGKDVKKIELEEELISIKNETDVDEFVKKSKEIKDKISDSKIDAYIAFIAEKNGELDYAYDSIREAISKQPTNELYKKIFKRIYDKRAKIIMDHREEIIKHSK